MKITLLVDNQPSELLQSEFGLSLLLENSRGSWLFDCGADTALKNNAAKLAIPPEKLSRIILSHGHYDHTGGLAQLDNAQEIFCAMGAATACYSFHSADDIHAIGMPEAAVKVFHAVPRKHYITRPQMIAPELYLTGPIERLSNEDTGGRFFHNSACTVRDRIAHEQALVTTDGVLITGCCHAGVINTLEHCRKYLSDITIHTIVGGLHLRNANEERLQQTASYLANSSVKKLYLMHCTGSNAIEALQKLLPEKKIAQPKPGESWEC